MIDMTGKKFWELTVLGDSGKRRNGDKAILWKVRCSCGKEKLLPRCLLIKYKSCGCKKIEFQRKAIFKGVGDIYREFWKGYVCSAKQRNLKFQITMKYVWNLFLKQNKKCALTGEPLTFQTKSGKSDGTASLDRIDSTKGYIEGNVQWVHKNINMMKQEYPTQLFFEWCRKVVKHNKLT